MSLLDIVKIENDVYFLSDIDNTFEKLYLAARKKENRIYSNAEVSSLPFVSVSNQHFKEWELRKITSDRFISYLNQYDNELKVLDVGCGNGWFSSLIAKNIISKVYGLDVNKSELEQAAQVFKYQNLQFIYGNLLDNIFPEESFDIITLNASAQYFKDLGHLLRTLLSMTTNNGEIHLLDTPFYRSTELAATRERTTAYYRSIGYIELSKHYFHHSYEEIEKYNYSILFSPNSVMGRIKKLLNIKVSPFPWIKIIKSNW